MLTISSLAALTLGLTAVTNPIATPVMAQSTDQARVVVPYADLDLKTPEGREALDRRLARAARDVCGAKPDLRNMRALSQYRECLAASKKSYEEQRVAAVKAVTSNRVAVLADKLSFIALR
ncbi:MAG: UrcA family protein [Pseudomonadota bacterium]